MEAKKNDEKPRNFNLNMLMVYDPNSETLREIRIDNKTAETSINQAVVVEETKTYEVDTSVTSPDGYVLEGPNYNDGGLLGGLFGGGYRNSNYRIKKGNIAYLLPRNSQFDYYNQIKLIGWVIKK